MISVGMELSKFEVDEMYDNFCSGICNECMCQVYPIEAVEGITCKDKYIKEIPRRINYFVRESISKGDI